MENNPYESIKEWSRYFGRMIKRAGVKQRNNKDFQFWQQYNHPIEMSGNEIIQLRLDYIHNNPVEAGFVSNPTDWIFSSACDYEGRKGLIDVFLMD